MAVKTYAERLDQVEAAIERAEKSQSYQIETGGGSRRQTRADLAELYKERRFLARMADREARGSLRVRYGTPLS